jgi:hypothetical protein
MSSSDQLVPCSQEDFLEQDKPIRGQSYVCLSFLSPEEILKSKETFYIEKMLKGLSKDLNDLFEGLAMKYKDDTDGLQTIKERFPHFFNPENVHDEYVRFVGEHPEYEKEFSEKNQFRTSVRGIKVRGSYETLREAQIRSEVLTKLDPRHNIYIAEVGCWCPWSPNPNEIENQEYAETALNTLMKQYRENQLQRDEFYEKRKDELVQLANAQRERVAAENAATSVQTLETSDTSLGESLVSKEDPWVEQKRNE